jgi:DNA-binding MarR family transcriptional regulator
MPSPAFTLDAFLPYRLSVASNAVSSRISQSYRKRFGFKIAEWRVMAILGEHDAITPQGLVSATRMDKISISRAASALTERGLVVASNNPGDGRSHILSLTPDGRALYAEILPLALETEARLLASFSEQERKLLETLLRRIETAAESAPLAS